MVATSVKQHHFVLFDGDCGFCDRAVALAAGHFAKGSFVDLPLTSDHARELLAEHGITAETAETVYVIPAGLSDAGVPLSKSEAVLFIVRHLTWPWRALALLGWLPDALLDWAYDLVARNRHMFLGSPFTCPIGAVPSRSRPVR